MVDKTRNLTQVSGLHSGPNEVASAPEGQDEFSSHLLAIDSTQPLWAKQNWKSSLPSGCLTEWGCYCWCSSQLILQPPSRMGHPVKVQLVNNSLLVRCVQAGLQSIPLNTLRGLATLHLYWLIIITVLSSVRLLLIPVDAVYINWLLFYCKLC